MARIYDFEEFQTNKMVEDLYTGSVEMLNLCRDNLSKTIDIVEYELDSIVYETNRIEEGETYNKLLSLIHDFTKTSEDITNLIRTHNIKFNGGEYEQ